MGQKVLAGLTMSLDGFITGPNDRPGAGLGDGGERLHYWVFGGPWSYDSPHRGSPAAPDKQYLDEAFSSVGAWLVGRTMHDVVDGWGDDPGFGVPVYVVTHRPRATEVKGDTTFEFVTDGADAALARARKAAGDKNVLVMGGANLLGQYLAAGVIDELTVTIAPVLLGSGKRFFDGPVPVGLTIEQVGVIQSPFVTHLRYRLTRLALRPSRRYPALDRYMRRVGAGCGVAGVEGRARGSSAAGAAAVTDRLAAGGRQPA